MLSYPLSFRSQLKLLALTLLAACTQNKLAPYEFDQEITFRTISTKSAEGYDTGNTFRSWAYMHSEDYSSTASGQLYLGGTDGLVISHQPDGNWKNSDNVYYWPKQNKLTFFAYALNSPTNTLASGTVQCDFNSGIIVNNYNIQTNLNVDFLVADVAANQRANADPATYFHVGVPTLFKHKLSNIVFTIRTKQAYEGKTFSLESITLNGVAKDGGYIQNPLSPENELWNAFTPTNITYCNSSTPFSSTAVTPTALQSLYIPQLFSPFETVQIIYKIMTDNGTGTPIEETVTETKKLSEIFPENWKIGKKYTCNIIISLDEIYWDPTVQDWTDEIMYGMQL